MESLAPQTVLHGNRAERTQRRLLIVDGHAYAYRAFHAIRHLNSPSGAPTNAIFGFIKMLTKMAALLQPSHLSVVWDGGLAAERLQALPEYKVNRAAIPADLELQIPELWEYLEAAGLSSFCQEAVEADDWIAMETRCANELGLEVVIASADKDFLQLIAPGVSLLNPNDKTETLWNLNEVRAKTGVAPSQVVDWLSLIGDSVDNIAGVPGVGPKTATDLLRQFGSVDALYDRLGEVKSEKLRASLQSAEPAVRRNQKLIRLRDDLPCDFSLEKLEIKDRDVLRLRSLYSKWGFKTLLAEVSGPESPQGSLL